MRWRLLALPFFPKQAFFIETLNVENAVVELPKMI
jgi:hypothetical protein